MRWRLKKEIVTYCDNQFDLWLRKSCKIGNKNGKSAHLETRKLPIFVLCVLAVMLVTQKETKKSVFQQSHVLQQVKQIQYVTSVVKHTNVCVICIMSCTIVIYLLLAFICLPMANPIRCLSRSDIRSDIPALSASLSSSPQTTHIYWLAWTSRRFTQRQTVSSHTKARWPSLRASRRPHGSWWTSPCIWLACRWAALSQAKQSGTWLAELRGDCLSEQCDLLSGHFTTLCSGRLLLSNFSSHFFL